MPPRIAIASRLFIPMLVLTFLCFQILQHFHLPVYDWLKNTRWLPAVATLVSMGVCILFGRSRLVFASLCWFMLTYGSPAWLAYFVNQQEWFLLFLLPLGILLWQKDKGFQPAPFISAFLILVLSSAGLFLFFTYLEHRQIFSVLYQWMYQLSPTLNQQFSPMQLVLFILLISSALMRLLLQASQTNALLITHIISLILLHSWQQPWMMEPVLIYIATLTIAVVILESYGMAFRDELTAIPSRRAMQQYTQTLGHKYVVVMSDIDHFKKFNDTYGHDVGDQVLKLVASRLNKVRGGGKAFRYGGEEFTLIFPRKSIEQVLPFVEELRSEIADYQMVIRQKDRPEKGKNLRKNNDESTQKIVSVTCSFGVAERTRDLTDFADVMKQADIALYQAKGAGRNCVRCL